jgi:hypothetical protein
VIIKISKITVYHLRLVIQKQLKLFIIIHNIKMHYWNRRAYGPEYVPRPRFEHGGGIFMIFSDGECLSTYWYEIKLATETGELGHYSAFSDDDGLICVHHSDPWNFDEKQAVREKISEILGIPWDVRYKTQIEAQHV